MDFSKILKILINPWGGGGYFHTDCLHTAKKVVGGGRGQLHDNSFFIYKFIKYLDF